MVAVTPGDASGTTAVGGGVPGGARAPSSEEQLLLQRLEVHMQNLQVGERSGTIGVGVD